MSIKIMIATHRQYQMPEDDIYLPVHVGHALAKNELGYTGDDTGDNISTKNPNYCELTALYWGWKNLKDDYIGLAHYRRHFCVKSLDDKFKSIMTTQQALDLCEKYDIIVPCKRNYYIDTIWKHYMHTHDISHLEKTKSIIEHDYPEFLDAFDKVMKRTWAHVFNMFLMKRELADQYCTWLFDILFKLEPEIDLEGLSSFDARLFGRVSELLLDVWLEKNGYQYKEIGFVQMGDENWTKKILSFLRAKFLGTKYSQSR